MTTSPSSPATPYAAQTGGSRGLIAVILCMVYLLVRGQKLLALPLFSDEAIYLRWAQLIRNGHGWVSLVDPKPPLHFWVLAGVIGWTHDPLSGARALSLFAGLVSIPAMLAGCGELAALHQLRETESRGWRTHPLPSGWMLGLFTAILMIFCPFLAFYQRLATADALFVLEMLVTVWLAMRWARQCVSGKSTWKGTVALGVMLGAALMTRQGLSYTLWGVPVLAVLLQWRDRLGKGVFRRILLQGCLAAGIALLLWLPYLMADLDRSIANARAEAPAGQTVSVLTVIKQRILYQDQFTGTAPGVPSRLAIVRRNASMAFLPSFSREMLATQTPVRGWLFYYLTWPVYALAIAGAAILLLRREWRTLMLLAGWVILMMGPVIVLGNVVFSRYLLAGAVPLLILAAYGIAELLALVISSRLPPAVTWSIAGIFLAVVVVVPLRQVGLQSTDWWRQTLTADDREQYISGWTAGTATHKALTFIEGYAMGGPVVVITDNGWGLPSDGLWAYLEGRAGMQVFYTSVSGQEPILQRVPGTIDTYLLRSDKWLYTPAHPVRLAPQATVLFVTQNHDASDGGLLERLRQLNPNLHPVLSFYGIDNGPDHVLICELK